MSKFGRLALIGLLLALAAVAVRLGVWQLDRLSQRRATNDVELAARGLPILDLSTPGVEDSALAGRRVATRGAFLTGEQLILRSRVHRKAPGVHVMTPFRVAGTDRTLWVLRGFAHAADGASPGVVPDPIPGEVTIRGVMAAFPVTGNGGRPAVSNGDTTWQRLDSAVAMSRFPNALPAYLYLEGEEGGPGQLPAVAPPALDEGPHLSYAIQWFGIAIAIVGFGIIVLRRGGRSSAPPPEAP